MSHRKRNPIIPWSLILWSLTMGIAAALLMNILLARAADASSTAFQGGKTGRPLDDPGSDPLQRLTFSDVLTATAGTTGETPQANKDNFGYLMTTNILPALEFESAWQELTGTSAASMTIPADDGRLINIGFTFPFYEGDYTQLYINDNGLLTFLNRTQKPSNVPIPRDTLPNNYIAAFWDNLDVGKDNKGVIYYLKVDGPTPYLIIEWADVTRSGALPSEVLRFQIKLTQRGDIYFYYKNMQNNGSFASAGIEDPDGVDGIQVSYRQVGFLVNQRAVNFIRPLPGDRRVKVLPTYRGQFMVNGVASFPVTIRNISDESLDTYNLSLTGHTGWAITFVDQGTGQTLVMPFNLLAGATKKIYVVIKPLFVTVPGDYVSVTLTVQSTLSLATGTTRLQAAVPAAFAMAYYQSPDFKTSQDGKAFAEMVWRVNEYRETTQDPFSGSNLAMTRAPDKSYVYVWDHPQNPSEGTSYREVRFLILNRFGGVSRGMTDIDDHASPPDLIADTEPAVAVAPGSGRIGFAWKRAPMGSSPDPYIENIYFVVRNADGTTLLNPISVTNTGFGERVDNVNISATSDNLFIVVWEFQTAGLQNPPKELWYAVFNDQGTLIRNPDWIVKQDGFNYSYPSLTNMNNGKVLLSYTQENISLPDQSIIKYRLCSTDCQSASEKTLNNALGRDSHSALFSNGSVVLAWTNFGLDTISYALITNVTNPDPSLIPVNFTVPTDHSQDYLSVKIDAQDRAVLVWMDAVNSNYFYYALLNSSGAILTPPMTFMGEAGGLAINTSEKGQGIALYDGAFRSFLPFTKK